MKTPKSDKIVFKTYQQGQPIFLPPSLDELIPPGHVVRVVNETIERMNIDPILAGYKGGGTSAYHPRMLLKVLVYAYMEQIYSSRAIAKALRERVTFMWLAGGNRPDFRTINRFRSSRLKGTIEEVFASLVELCVDKGLLSEDEVFTDGTKIEANANKYTHVWKKSNDRYKEQRKAKIKAQLGAIDEIVEAENRRYGDRDLEELGEDSELTSVDIEAKVDELNEIVGELKEDDSEEVRQQKKRAGKALKQIKEKELPKLKQYEEQEKTLGDRNSYSRTDVDATFMRMKEDAMQSGELKPGYNVQLSSSHQFVAGFSVHQSAGDSPLLMEHLDKVEAMVGTRPRVVVADAGYGSEENYALLEERGIKAYVKFNTFEQERKPGFKNKVYELANWPYDPEQDAFTCPEGRLLCYRGDECRTSRTGYVRQLKIYKVRSCAGCPVRKACMPRGGKTKRVEISEETLRLRRQAFELLESDEGKRLRAQRSCDVESVFGQMKGNRGFRRFFLRGIERYDRAGPALRGPQRAQTGGSRRVCAYSDYLAPPQTPVGSYNRPTANSAADHPRRLKRRHLTERVTKRMRSDNLLRRPLTSRTPSFGESRDNRRAAQENDNRPGRTKNQEPSTGKRLRLAIGVALAVFIGIGFVIEPALAQSGTFFNQRDDEYRLLGLKRAKEAYETAKAEYERQKALGDKSLISDKEVEAARRNYSDAEVNYQQSLLAVVFEQQYVVVSRAIKYQTGGTRKGVRLTLENASGGGAEFQKLVGIDDDLFRSLQPDVVNNVYVSLLNEENAIISQPYERKIDRIRFGEPITVEFGLLQDVDAVTVSMIYGTGTTSSRKIYLQKDASVNIVAVEAEQFSQEVELGGSTDFALTLELFSGESNTYKLEVVNLPTQINRYFVDPATDNRLSQFQFTEGVNTRRAALRVFLPERPTEEVIIDRPRMFYALAIPRERVAEVGPLTETMTEEEIQALNVGYERLELIPRGTGELLVRAQILTYTIKPTESVSMQIDVVNEGSRRLDNIRVEADPPLNWSDVIDPPVIPQLSIREESKVTLTFTPPPGVAPGNYDVRIRTTSLSEDLPIRGEDKTITIKVEEEANVFGTAIIVLLIVGLVTGIVVFGIRLSRR